MPKQELVIEGARALIVYVLAAVFAVLLVYLIDRKGDATRQTARGLVVVGGIGLVVSVILIRGHHKWSTYLLLIAALAWITLVAFYFVGLAMQDFRRRSKLRQAGTKVIDVLGALNSAEDARDGADEVVRKSPTDANKTACAQVHGAALGARKRFKRAVEEWAFAADRVIDLHESVRQGTMKAERDDIAALSDSSPGTVEMKAKLSDAERALGNVVRAMRGQVLAAWGQLGTRQIVLQVMLGCLGVAIFASIAAGAAELPQQVLLLVLVVIALLTAMNVFVARATDKFALYGIAVFFSVLLFGSALTMARTLDEPKVQPVALLRKGNEIGLCGVYITQTKERVYVGRLRSAISPWPDLLGSDERSRSRQRRPAGEHRRRTGQGYEIRHRQDPQIARRISLPGCRRADARSPLQRACRRSCSGAEERNDHRRKPLVQRTVEVGQRRDRQDHEDPRIAA